MVFRLVWYKFRLRDTVMSDSRLTNCMLLRAIRRHYRGRREARAVDGVARQPRQGQL